MNGTSYIVNVTEAYINCIGYITAVTQAYKFYSGYFAIITNSVTLITLLYRYQTPLLLKVVTKNYKYPTIT
jgi:hypothetical protein